MPDVEFVVPVHKSKSLMMPLTADSIVFLLLVTPSIADSATFLMLVMPLIAF